MYDGVVGRPRCLLLCFTLKVLPPGRGDAQENILLLEPSVTVLLNKFIRSALLRTRDDIFKNDFFRPRLASFFFRYRKRKATAWHLIIIVLVHQHLRLH